MSRTPVWEAIQTEEWLVMKADRKCSYCQIETDVLTMDHVIPKSKGGPDTPFNIVPACNSCNRSKAATSLLIWLLLRGRDLVRQG